MLRDGAEQIRGYGDHDVHHRVAQTDDFEGSAAWPRRQGFDVGHRKPATVVPQLLSCCGRDLIGGSVLVPCESRDCEILHETSDIRQTPA
jgi:hypothetical protein